DEALNVSVRRQSPAEPDDPRSDSVDLEERGHLGIDDRPGVGFLALAFVVLDGDDDLVLALLELDLGHELDLTLFEQHGRALGREPGARLRGEGGERLAGLRCRDGRRHAVHAYCADAIGIGRLAANDDRRGRGAAAVPWEHDRGAGRLVRRCVAAAGATASAAPAARAARAASAAPAAARAGLAGAASTRA